MKKIFFIFCLANLAFTSQVEITSKEVFSDNNKGVTIFTGQVKIKKTPSIMEADRVEVYANSGSEITKIKASGNASFFFAMKNDQKFKGSAKKFEYYPQKEEIRLIGNANVEDLTNKRKLIGEEIIFNERTQLAKVKGKTKEPVKVIFHIDDNKSK